MNHLIARVKSGINYPYPPLPLRRTTPHTLRIEDEVFDLADRVANEQGLSFNGLMIKLLRKYLEYDRFMEKLDSLVIPQRTIGTILSELPDETVERLGAKSSFAGIEAREFVRFLFGQAEMEYFLRTLDLIGRYSNQYSVNHNVTNGGVHQLMFTHNLGIKWSLFLKGQIRSILQEAYHVNPEFSASPSFLSCTFTYQPKKEILARY
jgi:hypothetical protein